MVHAAAVPVVLVPVLLVHGSPLADKTAVANQHSARLGANEIPTVWTHSRDGAILWMWGSGWPREHQVPSLEVGVHVCHRRTQLSEGHL